MLSGVKCKCPQRVAIRPSRKLYATKGTSMPSKYSSQSGGNCPKRNLIESTKDDSKYPKGKEAEWGCRPILAQRLIGGRGPLELTQMLWKTLAWNGVTKEIVLRSKALKVRRAQVVQLGVAHVQRNSPLKGLGKGGAHL